MKPKLLAIRPSELVILAIHNLGEKYGSSEKDIIRFISKKHGLDEDHLTPRVDAALKRGLNFGILSFKNGRYGLEDVPMAPKKNVEGNGDDFGNGKKAVEKVSSRLSRKRERSEVAERMSEIIEREIHQFKKARGFVTAAAGKPVVANGDYCGYPGETPEQKLQVLRKGQLDMDLEKPKKILKKLHKVQPKVQRKRVARGGKSRAGCSDKTRMASGRRQKKHTRGRAAKPKPRCKTNDQHSKKNGNGKRGANKGGAVGTLKSLANVFGMKYGRKTASKARSKPKVVAVTRKSRSKRKVNEKSCPRVCPRSCPNAIRRRQWQTKDKTKFKSEASSNKIQTLANTIPHPCENMGY